jgi:molecular chaperone GrpE (heat shock protein)
MAKWPFFLGSILLLAAAGCAHQFGKGPGQPWLVLACVALSAGLNIIPFILEYRAQLALLESQSLGTVVSQIQNIDAVAVQIAGATSQWQTVQEHAAKTAATVKGIADQMSAEARAFGEFMQKANDSEKGALRLELDKLHRAQGEWLQVVVRILDHIYAVNQGAARSGDANLIEQLGNFQAACRDAARRVGLAPFLVRPGEPFDPQRHQLADPNLKPSPGAKVGDTVATGFSFQGQMLRPALVRLLQAEAPDEGDTEDESEAEPDPDDQSQLPLSEGGA